MHESLILSIHNLFIQNIVLYIHIHTAASPSTNYHSCDLTCSGQWVPQNGQKKNVPWNLSSQLLWIELCGWTMLQVRSWTGLCHSLAEAQWSPVAKLVCKPRLQMNYQDRTSLQVFKKKYLYFIRLHEIFFLSLIINFI